MSGLFDYKAVKNKPSRSGFDLGNKLLTTAKTGELRPLYAKFVNPGETWRYGQEHITRTPPVNSSAFVRIKEYFDWFFVPMRLMWKTWGSFYPDLNSRATTQATGIDSALRPTDQVPYVKLSTLVNLQVTQGAVAGLNKETNHLGFKRLNLWAKLCSDLGYFRFTDKMVETILTNIDSNKSLFFATYDIPVNLWFLAAYHKIYTDFYRFDQWEMPAPYLYNFDYSRGGLLTFPGKTEAYWDSFTMFDMHYTNWNKDLFMGLMPNQQFGEPATIEASLRGVIDGATTKGSTVNMEAGNYPLSVGVYNGSNFAQVGVDTQGSATTDWAQYKPVIKKKAVNDQYSNSELLVRGVLQIPGQTVDSGNIYANTYATVIALRQAEALQRWKEVTQAGDQNYRDQIYKHFGVSLPEELSDLCQYLGGDVSSVDISEVVNTALTDDSGAVIKGKGVGVGRHSGERTFKEHGVLMCIYHAQPLLDYDLTGIDSQLTLTDSTDYFIPEFDRIGMEELPNYLVGNAPADYETEPYTSNPAFQPSTIGYSPRYYTYKTSIDRVTGDFRGTLDNWVAPIGNSYLTDDGSGYPRISYQFFKVDPRILDPIFPLEADSTCSTDQLWINCYFNVKAVRPMDYNGLPY